MTLGREPLPREAFGRFSSVAETSAAEALGRFSERAHQDVRVCSRTISPLSRPSPSCFKPTWTERSPRASWGSRGNWTWSHTHRPEPSSGPAEQTDHPDSQAGPSHAPPSAVLIRAWGDPTASASMASLRAGVKNAATSTCAAAPPLQPMALHASTRFTHLPIGSGVLVLGHRNRLRPMGGSFKS